VGELWREPEDKGRATPTHKTLKLVSWPRPRPRMAPFIIHKVLTSFGCDDENLNPDGCEIN
jgi:hypothetical protein